jgi:hypothetical protein
MDACADVTHDLRKALLQCRDRMFRASVLDTDSQLLAMGDALLEGVRGVFWPYTMKHDDIQGSNPAILRHADGTESRLLHFERCSSNAHVPHFHFKI